MIRRFRPARRGTAGFCAVTALLVVLSACGSPKSAPRSGSASVPSGVSEPLQESLTQAIEAAESILKLSPNDPDALLAAALATEHLGQIDRAIQYYARLQAATRETEYLLKLAQLQKSSNPAASERAASGFFEQGGEDDSLRMWLIRRLMQANNLPGAFRLTDGMTPPPSSADREYLRDLCLRYAQRRPGLSPDASAAIRRSAAFAPLPPSLAETSALALLSAGDASGARELLKNDTSVSPLTRAKIAQRLNDATEALTERLKYYYAGGSDPNELLVLLDSLGRAPPARQVAEKLWRDETLDHRARLAVAQALARALRDALPPDTAAEIRFLEEARKLGEPAFLERLAELQQSVGNAREALATLRARYPQGIPENKMDAYVSQALSAGEADEAIRAASRAPFSAISAATRRRLGDILRSLAEQQLAAGQPPRARESALQADRFWPDISTSKILAKAALQESDTPDALARLAAALKNSPADLFANYLTGKILVSQGRWPEAKPYLQKAYAGRYPEDDLPRILGEAYYREQEAMAYPLLKEYADAHPDQTTLDLLDMLGRSAARSGQTADAIRWFEHRLAIRENETISAELIDAALTSGARAKALGLARTLTVKYPASRPILESALKILDYSTDSPALLKTLESLSSLEPDPLKKMAFQRQRLDVEVKMGRVAEADVLLNALLARYPDDPRLLAAAWSLRKGTASAEPILRRLAQIRAPGDPIQIIRARMLSDAHDFSGAIGVLRDYLIIQKNDPEALATLADAYQRLGRLDDAATAHRELLKVRPDESSRRWLVGYIYDQALAALAAGRILPNAGSLYSEARQMLGTEQTYKDLYEIFGKIFGQQRSTRPLATDAFARELRLTQDSAKKIRLAETLGRWYVEDGQLALAKESFAASRLAGNTSAAFLRDYGALLARIGESDAAAEIYRVLLKQSPYDREANLYLARRSVTSKNLDEAIRSLEALRTASSTDSAALDALARAYVAAGRYEDAVDVWSRMGPLADNPKILPMYADALYRSGRHKIALQKYRELASSPAPTAEQVRRLAELEQSEGDWNAAESAMLRLLGMGGTDKDRAALADVLRRGGLMALQRRNAQAATRAAERLLSLNENDPAAFILMGRAKLLEGRMAPASESFSRAAAMAPKDPRPILGMAELEFQQSRWPVVIDYAQKAAALDPSDPDAYTLMGLAWQKQGEVRKAYDAFKQSLIHSKNRALAHVRMGDLFLQNDKYNVALEQYRQALDIDPKNALAHYRNALALRRLGFSENAMKELLAAIELDPQGVGAEATVVLSELFEEHGDNAKARELLESAASRPSAPPDVTFHLGEQARRAGEYEKSIRLFRAALAASDDPGFRYDVLNALGLALTSMNQPAAAEKTFREAANLAPDRPAAFLNLSLMFRTQKNFLSAVDAARKAITAAPRQSEGYKLLGLIYYEAGWEKESLSAFRESLRLRPDQPDIATLVQNIESGGAEAPGE